MSQSTTTAHFALHIPAVRNDFKVVAFEGVEAISALYAIQIDLVSEYPDFNLESLLGQPAFLQFGHNGEGLHGHLEEVMVTEPGKRLTRYRLSLVPRLHYLQFRHDQRIFQNLSVPQIVAQVLNGHGILSDAFSFHVLTSRKREYCTQYGESDFEFIQRLCAEDGIAWHYQHSPEGHVLVFSDDQTWFPKLSATPYLQDAGMIAEHPVVNRFSMGFSTRTSMATRRHYDFQRPNRLLESRATAGGCPELEDYCYPVLIENEQHGNQLARQALERHRVDYRQVEGASDQPTLRSGHLFDLTGHPRKRCNDLWLLLAVKHTGKQPQVLEEAVNGDVQPEDGFIQGYRNSFRVIPGDVFYRPPIHSRKKPLVSQTARVTGPAGEDIHCDDQGRVKVEFHWDRAECNSEKSSCWLRVSTSWAGDRFGSVTVPRIGMEVVVTYMEGNPDRPLITGCVPNKVNAPPYPLPGNKTKTVLRSCSTPKTGGFNELAIEDRAGREQVYVRAQRDMEQLILNDSVTRIGNDRHEQIARDSHCLIKGQELHITEGVRNTLIGANEVACIDGKISATVEGTWVIQAGPHAHVTADNVVMNANMSLTLKAGGHYIVISPEGIFSSVAIVQGGAPLAGLPPQAVMSAEQTALAATEPALLPQAQRLALMAGQPLCAICEAATPKPVAAHV